MLAKNTDTAYLKNYAYLSRIDRLGQLVQGVSLCIGWLSFACFITLGSLLVELSIGTAPDYVERPYVDPDVLQRLLIESALVLGCCVVIVASAEMLRRRAAR